MNRPAIQKFAAVRLGTDDFADPDCWYFNDKADAEAHATKRAEVGVVCEVKPVPKCFVGARITMAMSRCTFEQAAALMAKNAAQLRAMDDAELKRCRLSRESVEEAASGYEQVARAAGIQVGA